MLVGIHQPHYLPWLRYFEKIARSDVFIVLDNIQYSKNGWQNRNRVKTASGVATLTVPVHARLGDTLEHVCIDNHIDWARKHERTIEQAYGKAPYFGQYAPMLRAAYAQRWERLNALNRHLLEGFAAALGIQTPIRYASELDVPGKATERLVNLIKAAGGDAYYSGAYALDAYLDEAALRAAGIPLVLQEWHAPAYPQAHGPFTPDLSIVDLLMHCGPRSLAILKGEDA